jgi:hypothetical protein
MNLPFEEMERLNALLNEDATLAEYKTPYDHYAPGPWATVFGGFLVGLGNVVYGKEPSYLKFRAIEVIARVPYHSWASAAFTLLTLVYQDSARAMKLSRFSWFSEFAQDNETMHVVVISEFAAREEQTPFVRGTLIPTLFAFFYFWISYWTYLFSPRASFELNYLFENHAFDQYQRFLDTEGEALKKKNADSPYLAFYGRNFRSQYEFFRSVRNDEIMHRNDSIAEIRALQSIV